MVLRLLAHTRRSGEEDSMAEDRDPQTPETDEIGRAKDEDVVPADDEFEDDDDEGEEDEDVDEGE